MEPALAIFAPLIGHCFAAEIAPDVIDRHCFADVYKGGHVRDVHVVTSKGKQVYAGESVYSFNGKDIEFVYFNSMGGVGHGIAKTNGEGFSFEMTMKAKPEDEAKPFSAAWSIGRNFYEVRNPGKPPLRFTLVP